MLEFITETQTVWDRIAECGKPIAIYGMGDGAEKIIRVLQSRGISPDAVFASDEFVRGHSFLGYRVQKLSEVEQQLGDVLVVLCFASQRPEVMEQIRRIAERHELVAPDVPVTGGGVFDLDYLHEHAAELQEVYDMLADDRSRQVFADCLNYKISGKIEYLTRCETPKSEVYENLIRPGAEECYIDLGGYNGDTVREFLSYCGGSYRQIAVWEPDRKNYAKLCKNLQGLPNLEAYPYGAYNKRGRFSFAAKAGRNSALVEDANGQVEVARVDEVCGELHPTIIKFDVEGAELAALEGCEKLIRRDTPALMLSAYHRNEDLFALPLFLKQLHSDYRLYLRHHPYYPCWETNFYALPQRG